MAKCAFFTILVLTATVGFGQDYGKKEEEKPVSYQFKYEVKDEASGLDFGHEEQREDEKTSGEYSVLLPDGRMQMVVYNVIGDEGFVAEVKYEGEANYEGAQAQQSPLRFYPAPSQFQASLEDQGPDTFKPSPRLQYNPSPNYYLRPYYKARTYNLNSMSSEEPVPYVSVSEPTEKSSHSAYEAPTTETAFYEAEETETPAPVEAYEVSAKVSETDEAPVEEGEGLTEAPIQEAPQTLIDEAPQEKYNVPKSEVAKVQEYEPPKLNLQAPDVVRQRRFWGYRPYYRFH